MDARYEILEVLAQVPYQVVRCRLYEDQTLTDVESAEFGTAQSLRQELDQVLMNLPVPDVQQLREHLRSPAWKSQSDEQYSFSIYNLVIFSPDVLQNILELRSSIERISFLKVALLNPLSQ